MPTRADSGKDPVWQCLIVLGIYALLRLTDRAPSPPTCSMASSVTSGVLVVLGSSEWKPLASALPAVRVGKKSSQSAMKSSKAGASAAAQTPQGMTNRLQYHSCAMLSESHVGNLRC